MESMTGSSVNARMNLPLAARMPAVSVDGLFNKDKALDVGNIFRFLSAIGLRGNMNPKAVPVGLEIARLPRDRPSVGEVLNPVEKFLDYPVSSLGYACAKYMQSERLDADVQREPCAPRRATTCSVSEWARTGLAGRTAIRPARMRAERNQP